MRAHVPTLLLVMAVSFACSSAPLQSSKDSDANLSAYRTFAWLTQGEADAFRLTDPKIDYLTAGVNIRTDASVESRLRPVIERELQASGYKPAAPGTKPDFYVTYYGQAGNQDWISSWKGRVPGVDGVPVVPFPDYEKSLTRGYIEGMVYLTVYDGRTGRPAWTASVSTGRVGARLGDPEVSTAVTELVGELNKSTKAPG